MKLLRESLIILSIFFVGELLSKGFHLPVPGNIIGMLLLLLLLCFEFVKLEHIESISTFLLDHLAFFFIPAGVGLITSLDVLRYTWYKILIVCFLSTIIVMVCTGKTIDLLKKIQNRKEIK
ncbi:CidA/LrgA family protein [Clostridium frigidicarnis]|uniref:Holin-like protein n=1 Tax=Clostridium frigidicarnis TaxID=84698 RepID=A0A1I0XW44_9CLOT|nr:CidA/LrgA family protein [Clostridium frigidicarnis]SFB05285.1 holin-like protein [Clostridium frigidicarnis]